MTRKGRKIDPCSDPNGALRLRSASFLSILINNIQVFGAATENTVPTFIVRTLAETGMIAYDTRSNEWAECTPTRRPLRTGFPRFVKLRGDDGRLSAPIDVSRKDGHVHFYAANAYMYPIAADVMRRVTTLDFISNAIVQNVQALRQATALIYKDKDLAEEVERALNARERGESTVMIYGGLELGNNGVTMENLSAGATSNIPDFLELWKNTLEELDAVTGRAAIGEKNERRITEEIAVIENAASTSIDVLIDTVNKFAEWYGDDIQAVRGSSLRRETAPQPAGGTGTGETDEQGGNPTDEQ